MPDWKKAFGEPDAAFEQRVQRTLCRIQEEEEKQVKKKLSVSMALACALCLTVLTLTALAAADRLSTPRPDLALSPLSQPANGGSEGEGLPVASDHAPNPTLRPRQTANPTLVPRRTAYPTPIAAVTPTPSPLPMENESPREENASPEGGLNALDGLAESAAPNDYNGETPAMYYIGDDSAFYHATPGCFGQRELTAVFADRAELASLPPCPLCVQPLVYFPLEPDPQAPFFHSDAACGQAGAHEMICGTMREAESLGKTACPVCVQLYYCDLTANGAYHACADCAALDSETADAVPESAVVELGASPCPLCVQP